MMMMIYMTTITVMMICMTISVHNKACMHMPNLGSGNSGKVDQDEVHVLQSPSLSTIHQSFSSCNLCCICRSSCSYLDVVEVGLGAAEGHDDGGACECNVELHLHMQASTRYDAQACMSSKVYVSHA